jgi:YD repeat-containing protein
MVWDVASGSLRETLTGHAGRVLGPVFSPDGATVYTTSRDGSLMSWDLSGTRRLGRLFTVGGPLGGAGIDDPTPQRLGWSLDGTRLAATQADGRVVVLDTRTFEAVRMITPFANGHAVSAGLDGAGRRVVIGGEGEVGIWEVATGEPGPILEGGSAEIVRAVSFSPDGALVAGASDEGIIRLWDAYGGGSPTIVLRVTDSPVFRLVFSPDGGALLAAYGSGEATAWRVSDGSQLFTVPVSADDSALAAAYAPDGRTFVTGSAGGDLRFWDAATGEQLGSGAINPVGFVTSVTYSADGQTLATTWADGTTRLMDVATRTAIGPPLPGIANESELGIFLPDGRGVMVVSLTGHGFLWDVDPTHWEERACAIAGRQLTEEEWRRYLPNQPFRPACPAGGA